MTKVQAQPPHALYLLLQINITLSDFLQRIKVNLLYLTINEHSSQ